MDFKHQFNYNNQADWKRERFRLEIRRKNIQTYQRQIRSIHMLAEKEYPQQSKRQDFKHRSPFKTPLFDRPKDCQKHICFAFPSTTDGNEEELSLMQINCKQRQNLNRLEEISQTQVWRLCQLQTLEELTKIVMKCSLSSIKDKVGKILVKMCINETYWSDEFLSGLFHFLFEVEKLGINIQGYLVSLSECSLKDFKTILYKLMITFNIFEPLQSKSNKNSEKGKKQSCAIQVLYNFILVPPLVLHDSKHLCTSNQSQIKSSWFVQKVLKILAVATSPRKEVWPKNILCRITNQEKDKQFLTVLEIIYGLLNRLDGIQNSLVSESMEKLAWIAMREVLHRFQQKAEVLSVSNESNFRIKIKLKIFQIVHSLLSANNRQQGIALNFLYIFLNPLLSIIVFDFQSSMCKSENQFESDTTEVHGEKQKEKGKTKYYRESKHLKTKYELMLLQVMVSLLNVHDQFGRIPALRFIKERYSNFFELLYEVYSRHFTFHIIKANCMCQITEIVLQNFQNAGEIFYLSVFLEDLILERNQNPSRECFEGVLKEVLVFLRNQQQNNSQPSVLTVSMRKNQIVLALEKMGNDKQQGISWIGESILEAVGRYEF